MKGYKAFNKDLTCRGFQYEIGKEYEMEGTPEICERGFHFCKSLSDCYRFYGRFESTRICEIQASGTIIKDVHGFKYVTNKIKIVREIKDPKTKSNTSKSNVGYCNSGISNTGDCNSGIRNEGDFNSGDYNSGNCNVGDYNSGSFNTGSRNEGSHNTGCCNKGNFNTGDHNSGSCNTGDQNSGACNCGDHNSGSYNTGNRNSGACNCGNFNTGNYNSGDFNDGCYNTGVFNTDTNPKIKMFDKESNWTQTDWVCSDAHRILCQYPSCVDSSVHIRQEWWDKLPECDKHTVMSLPNFDADKFIKCMKLEHI